MARERDFTQVFPSLKAILSPYAPRLVVHEETAKGYTLITTKVDTKQCCGRGQTARGPGTYTEAGDA
jgi:hypothetical protein